MKGQDPGVDPKLAKYLYVVVGTSQLVNLGTCTSSIHRDPTSRVIHGSCVTSTRATSGARVTGCVSLSITTDRVLAPELAGAAQPIYVAAYSPERRSDLG